MQILTAHEKPRSSDWPAIGAPIDLALHDLPHRSASLEWWYVNGHVQDVLGREYSFFTSFFQLALGTDEATGEKRYAHAVTWALIDVQGKRYISESLVDRDAPTIAVERMNRGIGTKEPRLDRALREVLDSGQVPEPDILMRRKAVVGWDRLSLDFDKRSFEKLPDNRYRLRLAHGKEASGIDLVISLAKPVVRHGEDGVVKGTSAEDMFYYFCPRCTVEGSITLGGEERPITNGSAWYDHEFGAADEGDAALRHVAWNWLSVQLDNGCELTIYDLFEDGESRGHFAKVIDQDGRLHDYPDFTFEGFSDWTSTRTFSTYPTLWKVRIPEAGIDLEAAAVFGEQEFITFITESAFWEGRMRVSGVMAGRAVKGSGFVERANHATFESLDDFYAAVSRETRASIGRVLPDEPTAADVQRLIWSESQPGWARGVNAEAYRDALIRPIRSIADRGGKAWRSYCALVCCDAVGGDSSRIRDWMALPELLHVGSLMVDDIQDRSVVRRGGPPAHQLFGEGPTINAGTLCYFLPHLFYGSVEVTDKERLLLYDVYFHVMRAAHAGQGLDLAGADDAVAAAVETGNGTALLERIVAVHRLKSGAASAGLARMGGILGGASEAQLQGLGLYFQQVGIAFQVIDDVLNLRGFTGDLKTKGEDIADGKVTIPVAKALSLLPIRERQELWSAVAARPQDPAEVARIIDIVERCGALTACEQFASDLVEDGWRRLDPLLAESCYKLNMRAFGWYALERHY